MPKGSTIVVYKPDPQSTDEYMVRIDDLEQYRQWMEGGISIPLVGIVDSFTVFHTGQGTQGLWMKPSNQQLETIFGTHKDTDVVEYILKNGKKQNGDVRSHGGGTYSSNLTRGSTTVDTRGKGSTGI